MLSTVLEMYNLECLGPSEGRASEGSCMYGKEAKESICVGNINLYTIQCPCAVVKAIGLVWNVKDRANRTWEKTQE